MTNKFIIKLNIESLPLIGSDELIPFLFGYLYDELNEYDASKFDAELSTESESKDKLNYIELVTSETITPATIVKLINSDKVVMLFDVNKQKVYKGNLFTEEFASLEQKSNNQVDRDINKLDNSINKTANDLYKEMKKLDRGIGSLDRLSKLINQSNIQLDTKRFLLKSKISEGKVMPKVTSSIVTRIRDKANKYLEDKFNGNTQEVQSLVSESGNNKVVRLKEFSDRLRKLV